MENRLIVTASPHIQDRDTTQKLMANVVISLLPCVVASTIIFGIRALLLTVVTVIACVGFEYLYCMLMKKPSPVGDLSAVVTGIILAMNFPVGLPFWIAVVGGFVAIVLVKQLFGGIGMNFANPALVGRLVLFSGFATRMTTWVYPTGAVDQLAGATPLQVKDPARLDLLDLLLGIHGGVLGETCALACIIGFVWLVVTKTISPVIPVTYVASVFVFSLIANGPTLAIVSVLSGGLMFGAVFMATDYVTSPFTVKGKLVFGIFLGLITFAIRQWGSLAEGVSYAILLGNLVTPYINKLTFQTPLGYVKPEAKKGGAQ